MKLTAFNKRKNKPDTASSRREYGFRTPAMFDDFFTRDLLGSAFTTTGVSTPAVNIIETDNDFRLEMVAPGMKKEDFKVELHGNMVMVSYDHEDNRKGERSDWKYCVHEYNYHSFARSFSLPETVEAEKIKATYEDGILNLVIPKKEEARRKPARRISIS